MKFKILNRNFFVYFFFVFFLELESKPAKALPSKVFEQFERLFVDNAKATTCIELQKACDKSI